MPEHIRSDNRAEFAIRSLLYETHRHGSHKSRVKLDGFFPFKPDAKNLKASELGIQIDNSQVTRQTSSTIRNIHAENRPTDPTQPCISNGEPRSLCRFKLQKTSSELLL